jgi:hypothetical protein
MCRVTRWQRKTMAKLSPFRYIADKQQHNSLVKALTILYVSNETHRRLRIATKRLKIRLLHTDFSFKFLPFSIPGTLQRECLIRSDKLKFRSPFSNTLNSLPNGAHSVNFSLFTGGFLSNSK